MGGPPRPRAARRRGGLTAASAARRLKGGGGVAKKKKKRKAKPPGAPEGAEGAGAPVPVPAKREDTRTAAEKKYDAIMEKRELEEIEKLAAKSHRDKIREFNEKLESLSEHYDLQKVSGGG